MVPGARVRESLKTEALGLVRLHPVHPCLTLPIAEACERFDQVAEPSFKHFALPPQTPLSAVVEEAIRAGKTSVDPFETPA